MSRNDWEAVSTLKGVEEAFHCIQRMRLDKTQEGRIFWQDVLDRLARIHANYNRGKDIAQHKPASKYTNYGTPGYNELTVPKTGVDIMNITRGMVGQR